MLLRVALLSELLLGLVDVERCSWLLAVPVGRLVGIRLTELLFERARGHLLSIFTPQLACMVTTACDRRLVIQIGSSSRNFHLHQI